eukprot:gene6207-6922_t
MADPLAQLASLQNSAAIAIPQRAKLIEDANDNITTLSASPNISTVSHNVIRDKESDGTPLNSPWTFWFDRYRRGCTAAQYEANLKKLYTVSTIEGFWGVYNNIPDVGKIGLASYHLMRDTRRPIWEDECNVRGGYWKMRCSKDKTSTLWKELLLAVIGEKFSNFVHKSDDIVGISVSIRERDDIIQVWNQNAQYSDHARIIEAIYDIDQDLVLSTSFYKAHQEHRAFEGADRRRFDSGSQAPPGFGTSPRQSFSTPPGFGTSPHSFGTSRR